MGGARWSSWAELGGHHGHVSTHSQGVGSTSSHYILMFENFMPRMIMVTAQ